jgi:hypothetical protein
MKDQKKIIKRKKKFFLVIFTLHLNKAALFLFFFADIFFCVLIHINNPIKNNTKIKAKIGFEKFIQKIKLLKYLF